MIVVDASLMIDLLLQEPEIAALEPLVLDRKTRLVAPYLLDLEVTQNLRRFASKGRISREHAERALEIYRDLFLTRYPHEPLLDRVWELRHNFTAYDASYVALAESVAVPLWTRDRRMARAPGIRTEIQLF